MLYFTLVDKGRTLRMLLLTVYVGVRTVADSVGCAVRLKDGIVEEVYSAPAIEYIVLGGITGL